MKPEFYLNAERHQRAVRLLSEVGLTPPLHWMRLNGGANNQIFRVSDSVGITSRSVLLKAYFVHPNDRRDRLGADYGFSSFAWNQGIRTLARPLACDPVGGVAIFEYIQGRKLIQEEITRFVVRLALDFFGAVNAHREKPEASALPVGSEACFTLEAHLNCVRRRLTRLADITGNTPIAVWPPLILDFTTRSSPIMELSSLSISSTPAGMTPAKWWPTSSVNRSDRCLSISSRILPREWRLPRRIRNGIIDGFGCCCRCIASSGA